MTARPRFAGQGLASNAQLRKADEGGALGQPSRAFSGMPAHEGAPRYAASRSRSLNTPPAVTSAPAPGPLQRSRAQLETPNAVQKLGQG